MLPPTAAASLVLQGTAAVLWAELSEPASVADLAARMAEVFDASADAISTDIEPVLVELTERGAIALAP